MPWWAWLLVGFVLLGGELLTPGGFYLLFFGLGGILVGLLPLVGIELPAWAQWVSFTVFSIVATLMFRKPLLERLQLTTGGRRPEELTGETAAPVAPIAPGAVGKAELRGTVWSARNGTERELKAGQRCRVTRVEGLQLVLEPE
jgi:membrane protein implicated in regulation of membrane protease activity